MPPLKFMHNYFPLIRHYFGPKYSK